MANSKSEIPKVGSASAVDIYTSVGAALSWWEASEDVIMGLFRTLCAEREPALFDVYVQSPRGRRGEMLKSALVRHKVMLLDVEISSIVKNTKKLDRLAEIRNQIAHGHCSSYNSSIDGQSVTAGFYLLPSLNEGFWHERSLRYAHTAESINEFITIVREHRGNIMDVHHAVMQREQAKNGALSEEVQKTIMLAKLIVNRQIPEEQIPYNLRPVHSSEIS